MPRRNKYTDEMRSARPRKIRRRAISRNEILDQLAIGTDRRILAPFPSGDGRFVDTEFCCQLLLGQLNLDAAGSLPQYTLFAYS